MSDISRAVLFGKLNCTLYKALENAYSFSHLRENSYVELVHWLHTLLQTENTDIFAIIKRFHIDENLLRKDVLLSIEELPIGSTSISDFSEHIQSLVEHSWIYCSLKFGNSNIRTAHLIYSLLIYFLYNLLLIHENHSHCLTAHYNYNQHLLFAKNLKSFSECFNLTTSVYN